jgi:predicted short-subunit dehydrogenase-like oxidoreductase (DUF2520 family)
MSGDSSPQLVIVGPGRLGRTVEQQLHAKGWTLRVVGREQPIPSSPLTYLTVPDAQVAKVAARVPPGGVLLHASGALGLAALEPHGQAGSLHPLMSFPGPELAMPTGPIPAAVAGTVQAAEAASSLAKALGWTPFEVQGDRRLYHAAAVIAGNFGTTLLHEAAQVLSRAGVSPDQAVGLLAPLALASIRNAAAVGPARSLTGPVARGDRAVIEGHRAALASTPRIRDLYDALIEATEHMKAEEEAAISPID